MPSEPTLFDDDGDPFDAERRAGSGAGETADPAGPRRREPRSESRPNYLFRRAVVVGGVVAVIATAAIVIGNLIGTGSTSSVSGAIVADWSRIVQIDDGLGRITIHDDQGEELERIETGVRSALATAVTGPTALLVGANTVATVDLAAAQVDELDFDADRIATPAGSALTLVAADDGGERGLLVHAPSGERVDTTEFAPIPGTRYQFDTARATPSGRNVLVTDAGNFQSVLFSFDRDEPSFFPGLALALDDDVVVTAQNVGADATVSVFRHDGEPVSSGRTASVRAAIVADDTVELVTVDGQLVSMNLASGDTSDGERLDVGTVQVGQVWTSGDRLVVTGSDGTAVVSQSGEILASVDGTTPLDAAALTRSRCLLVEAAADVAANRLTMLDVDDGSIVAESDRSGTVLASADGCTALITSTSGSELLDVDGATSIDASADLVALAPDATAVVEYREGRALLVAVDDLADRSDSENGEDTVDRVDLGPDGRAITFTQI